MKAGRLSWAVGGRGRTAILLMVGLGAVGLALLHARPALVALLWAAVLLELGGSLDRAWLGRNHLRPGLALALGLTAVSLLLALLACFGLARPALVFPAAAGLAAVSAARRLARPSCPCPCLHRWLVGVAMVVAMTAGLATALLPPMSYDARIYHLPLAELAAATGRLPHLPENVYSHFPLGLQLHYALLLHWGGDRCPAVFHLLLAAAAVLALIPSRLADARFHALGALALAGSSAYWLAGAIPNVDMGPVLCGAAAAGLILEAGAGESGRRALIAAGFLLGGSLACKYSSATLVVLPLLLLAALDAPGWRESLRRLGFMLPGVILPALPYLARNYLLEGNPFFPLLSAQLGSRTWSAEQIALWDRYVMDRAGLAGVWRGFVPEGFREGLDPRQSIGMIFLVPAALAGVATRRGRALLGSLLLGVMLLAWGSRGEMRFLLPLFPLLCLAAGEGMARVGWGLSARLLLGLLCAQALLGAWFTLHPATNPASGRFLARAMDARAFHRAHRHPAPLVTEALNAMPDISRVLFVGGADRLGLRVPATVPTVFDTHPLAREARAYPDPEALRRRLLALGYSHLYWHGAELARLRAAFEPHGWSDGRLMHEALQRLYDAGGLSTVPLGIPFGDVALYRIAGADAGY